MNNGNIITPLTPDENNELNCQTPSETYTPSDSPDNQKKEIHKFTRKKCCKKYNWYDIIFLFFLIIINLSTITTLIIEFIYYGLSLTALAYCMYSFIPTNFFCEMMCKQKFSSCEMIITLVFIIAWWGCDFFFSFFFFDHYRHIKLYYEFIAKVLLYLKFGEITSWILNIFLIMGSSYERTGKIWTYSK